MPLINGYKYSCEPCIRGHRATSCAHTDRILIEVRKPGRPLETCGHQLDNCTCGRLQEVLSSGGVPLDGNQPPTSIPQSQTTSQATSQAPPQRPKAKPRTKPDSKISKRTNKKKGSVLQSSSESIALTSPSSTTYTLSSPLPTQRQVPAQSQAQLTTQIGTPVPNPALASVPHNTFVPYHPQQRVDQQVEYQGFQEYSVQSRVEDIAIPGNAEGVPGSGQGGHMFIRSQYFSAGQHDRWGPRP